MRSITLLAAALLLCSCTPPTGYPGSKTSQVAEPPVQRERFAYLTRTADVAVTCTAGADCAEKWDRALQWVAKHSVYSIKTHTESEIATNGPIDPTTDSAFTVTKSAQDGNSSVINFSSSCGQAPACVPTTLENKAAFNSFVLYGTETPGTT
jgi:hypothetical protein